MPQLQGLNHVLGEGLVSSENPLQKIIELTESYTCTPHSEPRRPFCPPRHALHSLHPAFKSRWLGWYRLLPAGGRRLHPSPWNFWGEAPTEGSVIETELKLLGLRGRNHRLCWLERTPKVHLWQAPVSKFSSLQK